MRLRFLREIQQIRMGQILVQRLFPQMQFKAWISTESSLQDALSPICDLQLNM